jgi:hypothetical protein
VRHWLAILLFAVPQGLAAVPQPSSRSMTTQVGEPSCLWLKARGEQLLERQVEALSITGARVEVAVAALSDQADLPISFIQTDPEETVSLDMHEITVRQALDAIVAYAPRYRYTVVSGRLVLYPRDPKWETRLDDVHLGPGPRIRITRELASELSRRLAGFADLGGPWVGFAGSGRAYTYQDVVSVVGPGSVLELLVQLLGSRPSTYFFVVREDGWLGSSLSVSSRDQLQSLKLTASTTTLRGRGESIQLKLLGALRYGGVTKDLTPGTCGTVYKVSDEHVLAVSTEGLVTARGSGEARVTAVTERSSDELTIRVNLSEKPVPEQDPSSTQRQSEAPERPKD